MTNQSYGFHIVRVGLGITFLWVGVLIFQDPAGWGGFVLPWVRDLLPVPVEQAMLGTAVFDIAVGGLLLVGVWVWWAAILATIHLASVLTVAGIDLITVRDIGLLAASFALAVATWPEKYSLKKRPPFSPPMH
ncbi:MAG: DoxX family membrane protein [Candidatus Niyogibacteria bacterium]|nr:DoxX family membrane protein [Candidatus Niyogibacteria bacterium]